MTTFLKWRHYLLGRHFIIWAHQQSLKFITEQREVGAIYQRWVSMYALKLNLNPLTTNQAADAFSRHPSISTLILASMLSVYVLDWAQLLQQIEADPFLSTILQRSATGKLLFMVIFLYKGRVVLPSDSPYI